MSDDTHGADQPKAPPARTEQRSPGGWGSNRRPQDRGPLKLLAALRGDGMLLWSGGSASAAYELDLFSRGPTRLGSGNLDGDFSRLVAESVAADPDAPLPAGLRLKLVDGHELEIDLVALEADNAEFEARPASVSAYLPTPPTPEA